MDYEFYVYDQLMYGNGDSLGNAFFKTKRASAYVNETRALKIMKYAVEEYLRWMPEEAYEKLNRTVVSDMNLNGIMRHIIFPIELDSKDYYRYIVSRLYPEQYPYQIEDSIICYYKRILSGEVSGFKNGFFVGEDGNQRARICLQYVLFHVCRERFNSVEAMYRYFAKSGSSKFFKEYKLFFGFRDQFEFPLDFLYFSLPAVLRNEYQYVILRKQLEIAKEKRRNTLVPALQMQS